MTFDDDDARAEFGTASPLLKAMVSELEFEAAKHGCQVHFQTSNAIGAVVFVDDMRMKPLIHILGELNKKFKRKDNIFSFSVDCLRYNAVVIVASSRHDLEHLH